MIEIKNPCSVYCAGSCFDVPMCGALVQGISCIGLNNAKWCVGAHLVIFTNAYKCSSQVNVSLAHKRMHVLPVSVCMCCP